MRGKETFKIGAYALFGQLCNSMLSLVLIFRILFEANSDTIIIFTVNIYLGYLASARVKTVYLSPMYALSISEQKFDRSNLFSLTLRKEYRLFILCAPVLFLLNCAFSQSIRISILGVILYTFTLILDLIRNFLKSFMRIKLCMIYDLCLLLYFIFFSILFYKNQAIQILSIVAWALAIGGIFIREYKFMSSKSKLFKDMLAAVEERKVEVSVFKDDNAISQVFLILNISLFVIFSGTFYSGIVLASMFFLSVPQSVFQALIQWLNLRQKNQALGARKRFLEFFVFVVIYISWSIVMTQLPIFNEYFIEYTIQTPAQHLVPGVLYGGLSVLCNIIFYYSMESRLSREKFLIYRSCSGVMLYLVPPLICVTESARAYNLLQCATLILTVTSHFAILRKK